MFCESTQRRRAGIVIALQLLPMRLPMTQDCCQGQHARHGSQRTPLDPHSAASLDAIVGDDTALRVSHSRAPREQKGGGGGDLE